MIDRLSDLLPATNTSCYAWAFFSNHAPFSVPLRRSRTFNLNAPAVNRVCAEV